MTTTINMLAIDLAKGSFQVCAVTADGTCVNPRHAREFARATGRLTKSCRVDAQLLAEMGRTLQLAPASQRSAERQRLSDLIAYRSDITTMIVAEKNP